MKKQNDNSPPQAADAPPVVPSGVDADYTVKFKTRVDPNQSKRDDLENLLAHASELDNDTLPMDELSQFCAQWTNFVNYPLNIVRLPDPPERRMAGQTYVRPCFSLEQLGATSFDPTNFIATLQYVNHNSGGVFRVWLTDYDGSLIPGAHLQRVAISDPPRAHNLQPTQPVQQQFAPPQQQLPPREKSESERKLEETKDQLFNTALQRALNPPQQQASIGAPGSNLPPEDQATLFLLSKTDFLSGIFGKMADLAQQSASVTKEPSWKERAIDAGVELATKNPAIVDRLSGVVERIIARVLPDPKLDNPQLQPQPQNTTFYQPQPQPATQEAQPLPEAPDADEDDDDTMDIIDRLTALLNSDTPLALSDPLFKELGAAYPLKFRFAVKLIIANPLDVIIDWIKLTGGPPYVIMLEGHGGEYIIERLAELQRLIIEAEKAKQNAKTQAESAPASNTE